MWQIEALYHLFTQGSGVLRLAVLGFAFTLSIHNPSSVLHEEFAITQGVRHVVCAWGMILVVESGGKVTMLREKDLTLKLNLLFSKSLYLVALNLAQSEEACLPVPIAQLQTLFMA